MGWTRLSLVEDCLTVRSLHAGFGFRYVTDGAGTRSANYSGLFERQSDCGVESSKLQHTTRYTQIWC